MAVATQSVSALCPRRHRAVAAVVVGLRIRIASAGVDGHDDILVKSAAYPHCHFSCNTR